MNQPLHLIFYILKDTKIAFHLFIIFAMIFWCEFSYAQNFEIDSVYIEADTLIYTAPASSLYVGENTKISIKNGTYTKNLVDNIDQYQIIYIKDTTEKVYPIIENTPILLKEVQPITRLEKHSKDIIALEEKLQQFTFDYYPPIAQFSSLNSSKSAVTNLFEVYPKTTINNESIDNLLYSTNYFYKKAYYYYKAIGISYCIANLEIRSPSFFI